MILRGPKCVPPCEARPDAAHQTPVLRGVVQWIVPGDRSQTGGSPEIGRIEPAYDPKAGRIVAGAENDRENLVTRYIGMDVAVDVDIEVVETVFGIDEMLVHRALQRFRGIGESFNVVGC